MTKSFTYLAIGVGRMHKLSLPTSHSMASESLSADDGVRAKESKEMILQTKLIVVEILQVSKFYCFSLLLYTRQVLNRFLFYMNSDYNVNI